MSGYRTLFTMLVCLMAALPALAQDIRPADQDRMLAYDALFGRAVKAALAEGDTADIAVLTEALDGGPGPLDPAGDWNCRTLKLGGLLPLVVYGNFRCRIEAAGDGQWRLTKLTGSQFTTGTIYAAESDGIYLGVGHVGDAPATDYTGLPPADQTPVEPNQTVADVGFFEQMGPDRARLLLPDPILESDFDILYFTR